MQEVQQMQVQSLGGEDSPGVGNGSPLQYSCLENPMDRGSRQAPVHGVTVRHDWATEHRTAHPIFFIPIIIYSCIYWLVYHSPDLTGLTLPAHRKSCFHTISPTFTWLIILTSYGNFSKCDMPAICIQIVFIKESNSWIPQQTYWIRILKSRIRESAFFKNCPDSA